MAFKRGQPIQAGLGRADFSPILRGGQAMGNAYANVGATLASAGMQAVQAHKQKQQEKAQKEAAQSYLMSNLNMTPDEAKAFVGGVGAENIGKVISQMEVYNQRLTRAQQEQALALDLVKKHTNEDGSIDMGAISSDPKAAQLSDGALQQVRLWSSQINKNIDEGKPDEITTEPISGTPYAVVKNNGKYVNTIRTQEEPDAEKAPEAEYADRFKALEQAKESGTLTQEEFDSAVKGLKEEVYGVEYQKPPTPFEQMLINSQLAPATGGGGDWSVKPK